MCDKESFRPLESQPVPGAAKAWLMFLPMAQVMIDKICDECPLCSDCDIAKTLRAAGCKFVTEYPSEKTYRKVVREYLKRCERNGTAPVPQYERGGP